MISRRRLLSSIPVVAAAAATMGRVRRGFCAPLSRVVRVFYTHDYVVPGWATTEKAGHIADSVVASPIEGLGLVANGPLTQDDIARVHAKSYVEAIRTGKPEDLAESAGLSYGWTPRLWHSVLASNGGAVYAALAALEDGVSGALASGLHHARHDRGKGYCTFNGLALAVDALEQRGVRRILILDLDAHFGGGTHSLIQAKAHVHHTDVSVVEDFDDCTSR